MYLVVDANVVFSSLISFSGETRRLVFSDDVQLFSPPLLLEEINEHKEEIRSKSGYSSNELEIAASLLMTRIKIAQFHEFEREIKKATEACPDQNDVEYFALALSLGCAVWSNDAKLKKQIKVKVINTSELLKMISRL